MEIERSSDAPSLEPVQTLKNNPGRYGCAVNGSQYKTITRYLMEPETRLNYRSLGPLAAEVATPEDSYDRWLG